MKFNEITYLGPEGTYTHQVAEMRFGTDIVMVPASTIFDACEHVKERPGTAAVVPIENSSAGNITATIDILLNDTELTVVESISMVVRLALLGRKGSEIKKLYSHFAPFKHCAGWIRKNHPGAECREASSTAEAAVKVKGEPDAAVLGSSRLAEIYGLDILEYPVEQDIVNETEFAVITSTATRGTDTAGEKTNLAMELLSGPGTLCSFLIPFRDKEVNLTRIISRPVYGVPNEYAFYIDINGNRNDPQVQEALSLARQHCDSLRIIGSYTFAGKFHS